MRRRPSSAEVRTRARLLVCVLPVLLAIAAVIADACTGSDRSMSTITPAPTASTSASPRVASPPPATPRPHLGAPTAFMVEARDGTYAVNMDSGQITPIMRFPPGLANDPLSYLHHYAVAPDGRAVAALCADDGTIAAGSAPAHICVFKDGDTHGEPIARQADFVRGSAVGFPWTGDPFAWSPDGDKLVFYVQIAESANDVYVADLASGSIARVWENSGHAHLNAAAWSPDSRRLAIAPYFDEPRSASVLVIDAKTGGRVDLMAALSLGLRANPRVVWSPDSSSLALTTLDPQSDPTAYGVADARLYVVAADASRAHQVATAGLVPEYKYPIVWSPDGKWLVASLVSGRYPQPTTAIIDTAYLLRIDDSEQRIIGERMSPISAAWAPDRTHVGLWTGRAAGYTFAVIGIGADPAVTDVDAVLAHVPSPLSLYPVAFAWNADRTAIFYSILACGQGGCTPGPLSVIDAAGGAPRQLWDKPVQRFLGYVDGG